MDSMPSRSRIASADGTASGQNAPSVDYLKNVILQFLETREQKHKLQLIPVFRMLLHFDTCVPYPSQSETHELTIYTEKKSRSG